MNTTIPIIEQLKKSLLMLKTIYIDFGKEVNDNDPKFKVGDHVRISEYKNIFAKGYTPNWSKEIFVIKKLRIQSHGLMLLMILMMKKLLEHLMKSNQEKR